MKLKFLCVELLMKMRKIHCMSTEVIDSLYGKAMAGISRSLLGHMTKLGSGRERRNARLSTHPPAGIRLLGWPQNTQLITNHLERDNSSRLLTL